MSLSSVALVSIFLNECKNASGIEKKRISNERRDGRIVAIDFSLTLFRSSAAKHESSI